MTPNDLALNTLDSADMIIGMYIGDLEDKDILVAPAPGLNPIAWQIGHLISSEWDMAQKLSAQPSKSSPIPAGFEERHTKEVAESGKTDRYLTKSEYLELWKQVRALSKATVAALKPGDLDEPSGVEYAPTKGALANMIGIHALMHAGQFVALRRKLGKPVLI